MKRNHIKIVGSSALVMCMTLVMLLSVFRTEASVTKEVKYIEGISYTKDNTIPEITDEDLKSELDGYLFAGWYTKSDEGTTYDPVSDPSLNENYYAKYVPEEVLDIKAQISGTLLNADTTDDTKSSIRFVTSIDSTDYKQISFNIKRPNKEYDAETTKYVYRELYAVDATEADEDNLLKTYKPSEFHATSQFFKTWTISNVPDTDYNTDITVTPYWVTLDGTRVEGTKSIKSVNLGRSWVYIDTTANADTEQYGTKDHPFTALDVALNTVKRENGKIIVKGTTEFEVSNTFKWNPDKTKVNGKVRTITVTGENGTSSFISFNKVPNMGINDNVTFENVKVDFASQVYANGNKFIVEKNVDTTNTNTNLHGGAEKTEVENTHLEIYAGSWKTIYGGGGYYSDTDKEQISQGPVKGNTNIILGDVDVFHTSEESRNMVFGGGDGSSVGGNTNIIVGGKFNEGVDVTNHDALSTIYGGGRRSGGDVAGDTNITIQDDAKINYVYGGGAGNTEVNGTCNVVMNGGTVLSIWGGGAVQSNGGLNKDTSVLMNGGTVAQIFGGNGSGMTGNTHVEVLGGTITRRIYGGCYHDSSTTEAYVKGNTVVVIGKDATLSLSGTDNVICAGSRYAGTQDGEVGIMIFNGNQYTTYKNKIGGFSAQSYDYLIKGTTGGTVTTAIGIVKNEAMLSINPISNATPGTITDENSNSITYFKGAGVCELPERESLATQCTVEVDFNSSDAQSAIDNCEARIEGIYYPTLVGATDVAIARKDTPIVTLLKDVNISDTLTLTEGQTLKVQSENEGACKTITGTDAANDLFKLDAGGTLELNNLNLSGGNSAIMLAQKGTLTVNNLYIHDIAGVGIWQTGGKFTGKNIEIANAKKFGVFVTAGQAEIDNATITNVGTDGSGRFGIKCQGSGKLTITSENESKNGVTITGINKGGGIALANNAELNASGVTINGTRTQGIFLQNGAKAEVLNFSVSGTQGVALECQLTSKAIITDGIISSEAEKCILTSGTSQVIATNVSVNRASENANALVVINAGTTFTLREDKGISTINGKPSEEGTYTGRGVEVEGTFNLNGGTISNHTISSGNGAGVLVKLDRHY